MLPNYGYNNNYTIVQTADHVMIMTEMVHDVRIIRLGERGRALAQDHIQVVERVDECSPLTPGQFHGKGLGLIPTGAEELHEGAIALGTAYLHQGGGFRHHDRRAAACQLGGQCDSLGVVAG